MLRALLAVIGDALRNSFLTQQLLVKVYIFVTYFVLYNHYLLYNRILFLRI